MGSFLVSCGVSNRVIKEDSPIMLMFISKPIIKNNKAAESNFFIDWNAEEIMIPAIQQDCGNVFIDEKHRDDVLKVMFLLYSNSDEPDSDNSSHPSWKQYFQKKIKDFESLSLMNWQEVQEHFEKCIEILQNNGIAYLNAIHSVTCMMKVCHIDMNVIDCIKNAPAILDSFRIQYTEGNRYNRKTVENFEDYLKYLIIENIENFKKILNSNFFRFQDIISFNSADHYYYSLFSNDYDDRYDDVKLNSLEDVMDFSINKNIVKHFISYAKILGVKFSPSLYASQDYSEDTSKNNRNLMKMVFDAQKLDMYKMGVENGEGFEDFGLPAESTFEDMIKYALTPEKIQAFMHTPEVIVNDATKIVVAEAIGYSDISLIKINELIK